MKEGIDRLVRQIMMADDVGQQHQRGDGIEKRVVPDLSGSERADAFRQQEVVADGTERMGGEVRPSGASEVEGIDPRAEAVAGKRAQESFFGALAVGDDDGSAEACFELRPERQQGGRFRQVFRGDPVHLLGGPMDRLVRMEIRDEGIVVPRRD